MSRRFRGTKEELIKRIESLGFEFLNERPIAHAAQLKFSRAVMANFYATGSLQFQGANGHIAQTLWDEREAKVDE